MCTFCVCVRARTHWNYYQDYGVVLLCCLANACHYRRCCRVVTVACLWFVSHNRHRIPFDYNTLGLFVVVVVVLLVPIIIHLNTATVHQCGWNVVYIYVYRQQAGRPVSSTRRQAKIQHTIKLNSQPNLTEPNPIRDQRFFVPTFLFVFVFKYIFIVKCWLYFLQSDWIFAIRARLDYFTSLKLNEQQQQYQQQPMKQDRRKKKKKIVNSKENCILIRK